jgi:hypothetical protein
VSAQRFTLAAIGRTIEAEMRVREDKSAPLRSANGNYLADHGSVRLQTRPLANARCTRFPA